MPSADQVPVKNSHSTMLWPMWVVLIAGSTGSALRAVRPPNRHITPDARCDLVQAIAVTCEKDELTGLGGNAGAILFERSRELAKSPSNAPANGRRKITLATGALRQLSLIEDEEDLGIRTNRIWHGCSLRAGESERYQNGRW